MTKFDTSEHIIEELENLYKTATSYEERKGILDLVLRTKIVQEQRSE